MKSSMQYRRMDSSRVPVVSGVTLLSISALLGFVQERHRESPEAFARWRVVHAMDLPRVSRWVNFAGALVALPTYVLLPALVA